MLWGNRTLSEYLGEDIMWNILWAKKDQIGKFWFPVLREYLTVDDRFMKGRIKFMMVQVQADQYHGMLGYIEEKVSCLTSNDPSNDLKMNLASINWRERSPKNLYYNEDVSLYAL